MSDKKQTFGIDFPCYIHIFILNISLTRQFKVGQWQYKILKFKIHSYMYYDLFGRNVRNFVLNIYCKI